MFDARTHTLTYPQPVQDLLRAHAYEFVTVDKMSDAYAPKPFDRDDAGYCKNNDIHTGMHLYPEKKIIVAKTHFGERVIRPDDYMERSLDHETGHALDLNTRDEKDVRLSNTLVFQAAYAFDVTKIKEWGEDRQKLLVQSTFNNQNDMVGRGELMAILFAHTLSKKTMDNYSTEGVWYPAFLDAFNKIAAPQFGLPQLRRELISEPSLSDPGEHVRIPRLFQKLDL